MKLRLLAVAILFAASTSLALSADLTTISEYLGNRPPACSKPSRLHRLGAAGSSTPRQANNARNNRSPTKSKFGKSELFGFLALL
jgi:hypothetical protein